MKQICVLATLLFCGNKMVAMDVHKIVQGRATTYVQGDIIATSRQKNFSAYMFKDRRMQPLLYAREWYIYFRWLYKTAHPAPEIIIEEKKA